MAPITTTLQIPQVCVLVPGTLHAMKILATQITKDLCYRRIEYFSIIPKNINAATSKKFCSVVKHLPIRANMWLLRAASSNILITPQSAQEQ